MRKLLIVIAGLLGFVAFVYGMYWVFKTVSYVLFYEEMVKATITTMIKPEYLKH